MGRITTRVSIKNILEPQYSISCQALVDTGAASMTLPAAWKQRLGRLPAMRTVSCETATQALVAAEICGPVEICLKGFAPISSEVLFLDMRPNEGEYEPLIGYIVLQQSQAVVDMHEHRLRHVKKVDLK